MAKVEALREQFDRVDTDMSGEIDAAELSLAMVGAGQKDVGEAEAAELIDLVDKDGTGTLDFEEFVAMMTQIDIATNGGSEGAREERLNHAFDLVTHPCSLAMHRGRVGFTQALLGSRGGGDGGALC